MAKCGSYVKSLTRNSFVRCEHHSRFRDGVSVLFFFFDTESAMFTEGSVDAGFRKKQSKKPALAEPLKVSE